MENKIKTKNEIKNEMPSCTQQDRPPPGGDSIARGTDARFVVVNVPLDWPIWKDTTEPYTPPPEDYEKVIEASLDVPISELSMLAKIEVDRIYFDGLCGEARGYTKRATPFKNWVAYVVKCLWTSYNKGLLRGCRPPRTVVVGKVTL